jgi:hypothetical protein
MQMRRVRYMLTLMAKLNWDGSHQYSTQIYEGQLGSGNPICHRTFDKEEDFIEQVNSVLPEEKSVRGLLPELQRMGFIDIPYSLQMFDRQAALFGWHV